ncbi:MAG: ATP-binding domain-containing protein, partial [Bacteroidota bacterium]
RMAVVAPTGVAAINAKGVTIHSLFQLPFGVILPGMTEERSRRFSAKKLALLQSLDLLVIDEISMVRADVLDGIDEVLRRLRRSKAPFGGLQLLMIGDLHQLPPVVRDNDWDRMRSHYDTAYFFGSRALRAARPATIQLKHIYRQSDEVFIGLLNKVRNNQMDQSVFDTLNQRYVPNFEPAEEAGYITLSSHNNTARRINAEQLQRLPGEQYHFEAVIEDNFPESMYPNASTLNFKIGAQVMFNKNDTVLHEYFNGKIGKITAIREDQIVVQCPGEDQPIYVEPVTWENRKFEMNPATKEVEDFVIGTYTQHPLKLAWAITIHKSQGLTFDKVIIDAEAAFAHGQVYVALSRCKTFEGIVLRSRIGGSSVKTDAVVKSYSQQAEENQPGDEELLADKRHFQINCLRGLFAGEGLSRASARLNRALLENERYLQGGATATFAGLHRRLHEQVITISKKF